MAIIKVEHIGIKAKNLEASVKFYSDVLGFTQVGTLDVGNPDVKIALLEQDGGQGVQLEVIEDGRPVEKEGIVHHLAFTVDDVEAEVLVLKEKGVRFRSETPVTLSNGARYIFFDGPDGESLELFQPARG